MLTSAAEHSLPFHLRAPGTPQTAEQPGVVRPFQDQDYRYGTGASQGDSPAATGQVEDKNEPSEAICKKLLKTERRLLSVSDDMVLIIEEEIRKLRCDRNRLKSELDVSHPQRSTVVPSDEQVHCVLAILGSCGRLAQHSISSGYAVPSNLL